MSSLYTIASFILNGFYESADWYYRNIGSREALSLGVLTDGDTLVLDGSDTAFTLGDTFFQDLSLVVLALVMLALLTSFMTVDIAKKLPALNDIVRDGLDAIGLDSVFGNVQEIVDLGLNKVNIAGQDAAGLGLEKVNVFGDLLAQGLDKVNTFGESLLGPGLEKVSAATDVYSPQVLQARLAQVAEELLTRKFNLNSQEQDIHVNPEYQYYHTEEIK